MNTIDAIRAASRQLVRELGFMGGGLAGTDLSPSAVHALIEIEGGDISARDLAARLQLEKSSVSRMLRKLVESGDVVEHPAIDGRVKILSLTPSGKQRVTAIHAFAHAQVSDALSRLKPGQGQTVLEGLRLYTAALGAHTDRPPKQAVRIEEGYRSGLIARITQMHALYYAKTVGFGQPFESRVAGDLAEFSNRLAHPHNAIWTAMREQEIVGSIAIDGEDLGEGKAHLRWFIVDDSARGTGAGRRLLSRALAFVDQCGFDETHLWTISGLSAARHLYEASGFVLAEEWTGAQWGNEMLEQRFVRRHPDRQELR